MIHVEHFEDSGQAETIKTLIDQFGLSSESVKEVLSKYDHDYIQEKIEVIKNSGSFKSGKVRDLAAYLMDALKKDYKKSKSSQKLIEDAQRVHSENKKLEENKQEEQKKRYSKYVNDLVERYITSLHDNEKNELFDKFEQNCDSYTLTKYKKHGLKHAAVKAIFNMFIKNNKLSKELQILNMDEFMNNTH